jgi:hypothetical protein
MWFIIGFFLALLLFSIVLLLRQRKIVVRWYEWLIGILGIGILLFTIQNIEGALSTNWENITWKFLLVFGIPAVILLVVSVLLPWLRYRKTRH